MSIIRDSGLKQATVATERGWESPDGKLIMSSRHLLSTRVARKLATPDEIKRWAEAQLIEIESRENKLYEAIEINEKRLASLNENFEKNTFDLQRSKETIKQIEFHQKKIEHLNLVAQYEKSFAKLQDDLKILNKNKETVQEKLNTVLSVVPSLKETKSEPKPIEQIAKSQEQVLSPGQKAAITRRKNREAAKAKEAEKNKIAEYPAPPAEIIND